MTVFDFIIIQNIDIDIHMAEIDEYLADGYKIVASGQYEVKFHTMEVRGYNANYITYWTHVLKEESL